VVYVDERSQGYLGRLRRLIPVHNPT
jgi:hypothetical protein